MSNSYWFVPEDVKLSWSKLMESLTGYSNCWLSVKLLVKDGGVDYIFEPVKRNVQPRSRSHIQSNQNWWNPIRQAQSVGSNIRGVALLSFDVLVDSHGNPVLWTELDVEKSRRT